REIIERWVRRHQATLERLGMFTRSAPIFGKVEFRLREDFVFVLMPFTDRLRQIYEDLIKPTIENKGFACRRADDFKSNRAIMGEIWQALNEARMVVADLTDFNANVLYELGIAHTLGKDTILIHQKGSDVNAKFPFDLNHLRRIEYQDSATGGKKLADD